VTRFHLYGFQKAVEGRAPPLKKQIGVLETLRFFPEEIRAGKWPSPSAREPHAAMQVAFTAAWRERIPVRRFPSKGSASTGQHFAIRHHMPGATQGRLLVIAVTLRRDAECAPAFSSPLK
jgi:hypothetical protein